LKFDNLQKDTHDKEDV